MSMLSHFCVFVFQVITMKNHQLVGRFVCCFPITEQSQIDMFFNLVSKDGQSAGETKMYTPWKLTWHWKIPLFNRNTSSFMVDFIALSSRPSSPRTSDLPIVKTHRWWFRNPAFTSWGWVVYPIIYEGFVHPRCAEFSGPSTVSNLLKQKNMHAFVPQTVWGSDLWCLKTLKSQVSSAAKRLVVWMILGMKYIPITTQPP